MNAMSSDSSLQNASLCQRYRLTVAHFHRMTELGIFAEDEHLELVEGDLIRMSPIGEEHARYTLQLSYLFSQLTAGKILVNVQNPLILDECNEPEPDLMLLKFRSDFYKKAKPCPADVLLVIEVADTSLAYDKTIKIPLYAKRGIPEVWLINLPQRCLEIYRQPSAQGYQHIWLPGLHESMAPELLPEAKIALADLWMV